MARKISASHIEDVFLKKDSTTLSNIKEGEHSKLLPSVAGVEDYGKILSVTHQGQKIVGDSPGAVIPGSFQECRFDVSSYDPLISEGDVVSVYLQPFDSALGFLPAPPAKGLPFDSLVPFSYLVQTGETSNNIVTGLISVITTSDYASEIASRYSITNDNGILTLVGKSSGDAFPAGEVVISRFCDYAYIDRFFKPDGDLDLNSLSQMEGLIAGNVDGSNYKITVSIPYEPYLDSSQFLNKTYKIVIDSTEVASYTFVVGDIDPSIKVSLYRIMEGLMTQIGLAGVTDFLEFELVTTEINTFKIIRSNTTAWDYSATVDNYGQYGIIDVVDDLVTDDPSKALSASQGLNLKNIIDNQQLRSLFDTAINPDQGTDDGKAITYQASSDKFILTTVSGSSGSTTLVGLDDTNFGTLDGTKEGFSVTYDSGNNQFILSNVSAGSLEGLSDTDITLGAGEDGKALIYDDASSKFILQGISLESLTDTTFGTLDASADGKLVSYNHAGTEFVLVATPTNTLYDLEDTEFGTVGAAQDGYVVLYNDTTGKYELSPVPSGSLYALTDTNFGILNSGMNGYNVTYDSASQKFVLTAPPSGSVQGASDTNMPTLDNTVDGFFIKYDDTEGKFILEALPVDSLSSLTDTNLGTLDAVVDGHVVTYDNASGNFVLTEIPTESLAGLSDTTFGTVTASHDKYVVSYDHATTSYILRNNTLFNLTDTDLGILDVNDDGKSLTYEHATGKFVLSTITGGSSSLADLTDTNLGTLDASADGKTVAYDNASGQFILLPRAEGATYAFKQDLITLTQTDIDNGYILLSEPPYTPSDVRMYLMDGGEQVNKGIVGTSGITPDFEMDGVNPQRLYFKELDGHTGFTTSTLVAGDEVRVAYFTDFVAAGSTVSNLVDLNDTNIPTLDNTVDGYVVSYDDASSKFVLATPGSGTLEDLTDTNLGTLDGTVDGYVVSYDDASGKFILSQQSGGGGSYAFKQDLFTITQSEVDAGYITLSEIPYSPSDVRMILLDAGEQINSGIVGTSGVTPDFEMDGTNVTRLYFKNLDGHTGLSTSTIEAGDEIKVFYFTDFVAEGGTASTTLVDLTDTNITLGAGEDGKYLKYDHATAKFILDTVAGGSGTPFQVYVEGNGLTDTTTSANNATAIQNGMDALSALGGGELILTGILSIPSTFTLQLDDNYSNITFRGLPGSKLVPDDANTTSLSNPSVGLVRGIFAIGDTNIPVENFKLKNVEFDWSGITAATGYSFIGIRSAINLKIEDCTFRVADTRSENIITIDNSTVNTADLKSIHILDNTFDTCSSYTSDVGACIYLEGRSFVSGREIDELIIKGNKIKGSRGIRLEFCSNTSGESQWEKALVEDNDITVCNTVATSSIYGIGLYFGNEKTRVVVKDNTVTFKDSLGFSTIYGIKLDTCRSTVIDNTVEYTPTTYGSETPTGIGLFGASTYVKESIVDNNTVINFKDGIRFKTELIKSVSGNTFYGDINKSDNTITPRYSYFRALMVDSGINTTNLKSINYNEVKDMEITNGSSVTNYFIYGLTNATNLEVKGNKVHESFKMASGTYSLAYFYAFSTGLSDWSNCIVADNEFLTPARQSTTGIIKPIKLNSCIFARNKAYLSDPTSSPAFFFSIDGRYTTNTWFIDNILYSDGDLSNRYCIELESGNDLDYTNKFVRNEVHGLAGTAFSGEGSSIYHLTNTLENRIKVGEEINGHGFNSLICIPPAKSGLTDYQNAVLNVENFNRYIPFLNDFDGAGVLLEGEYLFPIDFQSSGERLSNMYFTNGGYFGSHSKALIKPVPEKPILSDDTTIIGSGLTVSSVTSSTTVSQDCWRYHITGDFTGHPYIGKSSTVNDLIGHRVTITGMGDANNNVSYAEIVRFYVTSTYIDIDIINSDGVSETNATGANFTIEASSTFSGSLWSLDDVSKIENITWDYSSFNAINGMTEGYFLEIDQVGGNFSMEGCEIRFGVKKTDLVYFEAYADLKINLNNCKFIADIHNTGDNALIHSNLYQSLFASECHFEGGKLIDFQNSPYSYVNSYAKFINCDFRLNSKNPNSINCIVFNSSRKAPVSFYGCTFTEDKSHAAPVNRFISSESSDFIMDDNTFKVYSLYQTANTITEDTIDSWEYQGALFYTKSNDTRITNNTFYYDYGNFLNDIGSDSLTFKGNKIKTRDEFGTIQLDHIKNSLNNSDDSYIKYTTSVATGDLPGTPWSNGYGGSISYDGNTYYYLVGDTANTADLIGNTSDETFFMDVYDGSTFLGTFSIYKVTENLASYDPDAIVDSGKTGTLIWFKMHTNSVSSTNFDKSLRLELAPFSRFGFVLRNSTLDIKSTVVEDNTIQSMGINSLIFHAIDDSTAFGTVENKQILHSNNVFNNIYSSSIRNMSGSIWDRGHELYTDSNFDGTVDEVVVDTTATDFAKTHLNWYLINTSGDSSAWTTSNYKGYVLQWDATANDNAGGWINPGDATDLSYVGFRAKFIRDSSGTIYYRTTASSTEPFFNEYTSKFDYIKTMNSTTIHGLTLKDIKSNVIVTKGYLADLDAGSVTTSYIGSGLGSLTIQNSEWRTFAEDNSSNIGRIKYASRILRASNNTLYLESPVVVSNPTMFTFTNDDPIIVRGEGNILAGSKHNLERTKQYGKTTSTLCGHADLNQLDSFKEEYTGHMESPDNKDYNLTMGLLFDGVIQTITAKTSSGSCDLDILINEVSVGTLSGVNTTKSSTTGINYDFSKGDSLELRVSNGVSPEDLKFSIELERHNNSL